MQRIIPIHSPIFARETDLTAGLPKLFPRQQPLALEIGCGIGDFIVQLAEQHPTRNYLAIDIYNKGCLKTCRRVESAGLDNVRVMRIEARYLLTNFLDAASLAAVYVNCPDPWPKKRHRDRRLVNADFLQLLLYFLEPDGEVVFSSDVPDYAEQVGQLFGDHPGFDNLLPLPVTRRLPGYPVSKYMRRFLERDQAIHFVHQRKNRDLPAELLQTPAIGPGFRVAWSRAGHG